MAFAASQQIFLPAIVVPSKYKCKSTRNKSTCSVSCLCSKDDQTFSNRKIQTELGKLAVVTLAAGVLTIGFVGDALAAKSGGRVGGQAFRSSAPRSSPRINNSRTNIYINPPVAPPLIGGYGYGYGYGWSPFSFFFPGPSVAVGVGGGFDVLALFLFLGAASAVIRKVFRSRDDDDDF